MTMEIMFCILSGLFVVFYFVTARGIIRKHDIGTDIRLLKARNFTFWISLVVLVVFISKMSNLWQIGAVRACFMSYFIAYLLFQSFTDFYTHDVYTCFDIAAIVVGGVNFIYTIFHIQKDTFLVTEIFILLIALLIILFVAKKFNLFGAGDIDVLIAMSLFMLPYGGAFGTASIIAAMIIGFTLYLISRLYDRVVRKVGLNERVEKALVPMLTVGTVVMMVL